jgi:hypothetical protein
MAKRSRRELTKKWLPKGSIRTMGSNGRRVWKYSDKEYDTMRDLIYRLNPTQKDGDTKVEEPSVSVQE